MSAFISNEMKTIDLLDVQKLPYVDFHFDSFNFHFGWILSICSTHLNAMLISNKLALLYFMNSASGGVWECRPFLVTTHFHSNATKLNEPFHSVWSLNQNILFGLLLIQIHSQHTLQMEFLLDNWSNRSRQTFAPNNNIWFSFWILYTSGCCFWLIKYVDSFIWLRNQIQTKPRSAHAMANCLPSFRVYQYFN